MLYENVQINDNDSAVESSYTLYQACLASGVELPIFCYHVSLTIAGNCRMCLIEDDRDDKLIVACATPVDEEVFIYTNTDLVLGAREAVLEYLLINHPLDCPICDQAGECDLQDQMLSYGNDVSRGSGVEKRSVEDKDYSILIKLSLNRCIHCTRCVRFASELSFSHIFLMLGRGVSSEIGSYTLEGIEFDEFSGNTIDLCPVGAITSKPYSFTGRP